jgi:hypothetical protein
VRTTCPRDVIPASSSGHKVRLKGETLAQRRHIVVVVLQMVTLICGLEKRLERAALDNTREDHTKDCLTDVRGEASGVVDWLGIVRGKRQSNFIDY